eukprot:TRINITY_DN74622_c0_g1_i1.p2 TRINITY_DN74622_c0_g1~~TRINITY_DN74622_c0_g1_i1.p2  ORF type:complete len:196 (+),score=71.72 TRINITY_DN74622_c0_g1_i1:82-669(+)
MADQGLSQVLALLVLDAEGGRLAVKYSSLGRKEIWTSTKQQIAFEKRLIQKMPKIMPSSRSEVDVAVIDDFNVLYQACNDVIVAAVATSNENELLVMQLVEGIYSAIAAAAPSGFLSSGLTKQLVLDNLADVLFILDEVCDDGVIMEVEEETISARIKMVDETEVTTSTQAQEKFQKATQSAKQKLLGSLIGSRG